MKQQILKSFNQYTPNSSRQSFPHILRLNLYYDSVQKLIIYYSHQTFSPLYSYILISALLFNIYLLIDYN